MPEFHIIKRTPIIGLEERKEEMEERSGIISDTPELTTVKIGTIPEKMNYNILYIKPINHLYRVTDELKKYV